MTNPDDKIILKKGMFFDEVALGAISLARSILINDMYESSQEELDNLEAKESMRVLDHISKLFYSGKMNQALLDRIINFTENPSKYGIILSLREENFLQE